MWVVTWVTNTVYYLFNNKSVKKSSSAGTLIGDTVQMRNEINLTEIRSKIGCCGEGKPGEPREFCS